MDCGYFSGYVAKLWYLHAPSTSAMLMSQEEVYLARNRFRSPSKYKSKPLTPQVDTIGVANGTDMAAYLRDLDSRLNFYPDWINPSKPNSWTNIPEYIRALFYRHFPLNPSRDAAFFQTKGSINGHWVVVLNAGNRRYEYYDPGEKPNGENLTENQLITKLCKEKIFRIVWSYHDPEGVTTHRVKRGESLSSIAGLYWKEVLLWTIIHEANIESISDPNHLDIGQQLIIPGIHRYSQAEKDAARRKGRNW